MSFTRLSLWTGRIPAKFVRSWRQVLLGRIWEQQIFSLFSFMCKHRKQDLRERRTPTYTFLNIHMIHTYIHFLSIHIIWKMITSCVNHKWGTLSLCSHPDKGLGRGSSHRFAHDSPLSAHFISSSAKELVMCAQTFTSFVNHKWGTTMSLCFHPDETMTTKLWRMGRRNSAPNKPKR